MRTTPRPSPRAASLCLLSLLIASPAASTAAEAAADEPTLPEIVEILRERGLLDEDQHADLAARAAAEEAKRAWTDRVSIWGDFRARYESFFYHHDAYSNLDNRFRARYRARLDVKGEVASRATVYFRAVSGDSDPRSTNQTLGSGVDFDTDDLRLDLAYATISPFPKAELPGIEYGLLAIDLGKVPNAFVWDTLADDNLLWDNDITLEGGTLRIHGGSGPVMLFSHTGVYVDDENASGKDPTFVATQLGATARLAEAISLGGRGSFYDFFSLDDDFFTRGASGGNFADGLSRDNRAIQVAEGSAFLALAFWDLFPIQVYGTFSHNFSARSSRSFPGVSPGSDAWVAGVSVGDKKLLVRVGMSYYYIEANAFPSMFVDSDVLDSTTNRKGFAWVLERQLFENVDFVYTAYLSNRIQNGVPYATSVSGSNRLRMRADLKFKF